MTDDLVTVVIPTYNHENYIIDSIESVLNQDYPNIELIVINDGSTDGTGETVKRYLEEHGNGNLFKIIEKENEGPGMTLARGLKEASGEYFCGLASDDIFIPNSISLRMDVLKKNKDLDGVFADVYYAKRDGEKTTNRAVKGRKEGHDSSVHGLKDFLNSRSIIMVSTGLFRTERLKALNGYDDDFYAEDVLIKYVLAAVANIAYIDKPVQYYRLHGKNISRGRPLWLRRERLLALEKLLERDDFSQYRSMLKKFYIKSLYRYLKVSYKRTEERDELEKVLGKLRSLRPFSPKTLYYNLLIK